MTAGAEWTKRDSHTSVALPDGSIVLLGGINGGYKDDVWRSTDEGATWTLMTAEPPWTARYDHTSVVLPDGCIVLMGGFDINDRNDVWRMETASSAEQHPAHTYVELGTYSVTLQVYNADGYSSMRKVAYINVADTYFVYLPLVLRNAP